MQFTFVCECLANWVKKIDADGYFYVKHSLKTKTTYKQT
jgi:hypothetical protein